MQTYAHVLREGHKSVAARMNEILSPVPVAAKIVVEQVN
jgi:hypothetical protein